MGLMFPNRGDSDNDDDNDDRMGRDLLFGRGRNERTPSLGGLESVRL